MKNPNNQGQALIEVLLVLGSVYLIFFLKSESLSRVLNHEFSKQNWGEVSDSTQIKLGPR